MSGLYILHTDIYQVFAYHASTVSIFDSHAIVHIQLTQRESKLAYILNVIMPLLSIFDSLRHTYIFNYTVRVRNSIYYIILTRIYLYRQDLIQVF